MDLKPKVTFIVPCFNQSQFLYESISSIMLSYSGPKEILILDDCSTDPTTPKRLKEIKSIFPTVEIIQNKQNLGLSAVRNIGISISKGDYIQFLDADDLLAPKKIDKQIIHLTLGNNIDISVTDYLLCDESLTEFSIPEPSIGTFNLTLDDFLYKWERGLSIPIHCALFKRNVFKSISFEESLRAKEDWYFWCEQALFKRKIVFLNQYGAIYRQHNSAMTKRNTSEMGKMWLEAALKIDKIVEKNSKSFLISAIDWYKDYYEKGDTNQRLMEESSENLSTHSEEEKELSINPSNIKNILLANSEKEVIFSIVIPIYNHYEYLNKCITSALYQYPNICEIICIDDNSSDSRVKTFLKDAQKKIPGIAVVYNNENMGISSVLNQGVKLANGKYVAFLDCDDYLAPNAVLKVFQRLKNNQSVDYFFSDRIDIDEKGQFIREAIYGGYPDIRPSKDIKDDLLDGMVASHFKVIRKSFIDEVGGFNVQLEGVQDWDLALRISEMGTFHYINEALYFHRQHPKSVTISNRVNQFRKTNIVRRIYCDKWFRNNKLNNNGAYSIGKLINNCYNKKDLAEMKISIYNPDSLSLDRIKESFVSEYLCIFDARSIYEIKWINFMREFNSYFDMIIYDDPRIAVSLIGYLWDKNILHENANGFNMCN